MNTKMVQIYTIQKECVELVADHHEFTYKCGIPSIEWYNGDYGDHRYLKMNDDNFVEIAEIQEIRENVKRKPWQLPSEVEVSSSYFVIEPILERIIETKYKDKITKLEEEIEVYLFKNSNYMKENIRLTKRLMSFNNNNIFKRLWLAIKGDL